MINIKHELRFILFVLFCDLLNAVQTEVRTVRKREGETVTFHPNMTELQNDYQILWSFGQVPPFTVIAQLLGREIKINYRERFNDRLQLDRQTGSLSIRNLSTKDSGVYQLQTINGLIFFQKFNLSVYSPVSKPVIRKTPQSHSVSKSCSVLCSVENGREVTLSWQREGETLSHTSSPDLNTPLSLPLEIEEYSSTYSCVADNPVSNQSLQLNTEELCSGHNLLFSYTPLTLITSSTDHKRMNSTDTLQFTSVQWS
ncbi:hepatocyte cell adhesion molecule-like [Megalops cyprinoides]|uniref:hepatocyte cell adhesion molecule-like n=1 Tax=Megalops cyprinoides TaxID=118141 RepID=UPI00186553A5|nr:hepatocyte cell adhesion molecule-like [Megalops cyprinoides]